MTIQSSDLTPDQTARRAWLSVLAKADAAALVALVAPFDGPCELLRAPEIGTVMVRGRMGGSGAAFNLGEMTVTRAAVRLPSGEVGHGHVQGRDKGAALAAARVDALMQTDRSDEVRRAVLTPLEKTAETAKADIAAKAAATKVDFFTMVRGED